MNPPYVIWSNEHRAWWGPNRWGYYPDLLNAGHYSREEAFRIVESANMPPLNPFQMPNEIALPLADAEEQRL